MRHFTFEMGDPYQKLDLEPADCYESDIDALEMLVDGEYDQVSDAARSLTPRTSHEVFRSQYVDEEPAVVDSSHVEKIVDVLDNLSDEEPRNSVSQELFNLGYMWREPFLSTEAVRNPHKNHTDDNIPEYNMLFSNPFTEGRKKREADKHYSTAVGQMMEEIKDWDVEIK